MPASGAARRRATTRLLAARLPAKLRLESSRPNSGLRQSAASPARPAQTPLPLELLACLAIEPSRIVQAQPVQAIESMPAVAAPGNACAPEGAAPGPAAHRTWRRTRSQRHPTTAKHRPLRTTGQDRSSILWRMLVFPAAFAHRFEIPAASRRAHLAGESWEAQMARGSREARWNWLEDQARLAFNKASAASSIRRGESEVRGTRFSIRPAFQDSNTTGLI